MGYLSEETRNAVRVGLSEGLSDRAIAARCDVSKSVPEYYRRLVKAGRSLDTLATIPHGRRTKKATVDKIGKLVAQGLSQRDIARQTGCSKNTVRWHMMETRDEIAPSCEHGLNIYHCHSCVSMRRRFIDGRVVCERGRLE